MKAKKIYSYLVMFLTCLCVISCDKDDSIAPIERGEKVLNKMELELDNNSYYTKHIITYSYDNDGNISTIDIVRHIGGTSDSTTESYIIEGNTMTSTATHFVECKLNDAKYIEYLNDTELSSFSHKFTYYSNGYLKASIYMGGNYERPSFEPIYDKQWRITNKADENGYSSLNSMECIWSDIPNKGNLFFWPSITRNIYNAIDIALANAGLFGKAQAFLPKKFGNDTQEWTLDEIKYELDEDGYVTKATVSDERGIKATYTFTYE